MTPEERFTKIENFLMTVAEHHADHDARLQVIERGMIRDQEEIRELQAMQMTLNLVMTRVAEAQLRTAEAQRAGEEKLNALIDTVDRIIRRDGPGA